MDKYRPRRSNRRVSLLFLILPLLLSAGCNRDDLSGDPGGIALPGESGDIRFEIGFARMGSAVYADTDEAGTPQTRVATAPDFTSEWEDGDQIGIFAVIHGQPFTSDNVYDNMRNIRLTHTHGSWSPDEGVELWYPTGSRTLDFYAYYPYDASASDPATIRFMVQTDQRSAADYGKSNLLTAKSDNSGAGYGKTDAAILIPLIFSPAMAMVQVSISSPGKGFGPGENLTVKLHGFQAGTSVNLGAITDTPGSEVTLWAVENESVDITMHRMEQPTDADYETSYTYRAFVPGQEIAAGNRLFLFDQEQGQLLGDTPLSANLEIKAGIAEIFTRSLPVTLVHTVLIPKGSFLMGSPESEPNRLSDETRHRVTLTKDFYMGIYPVTFAQYDIFCDATSRSKPSDQSRGRGDRPVINVSWYDATAYCEWLSESTGLTYRLPTEAEWEYACRGGTTTAYCFGNEESDLGYYGWSWENNENDGYPHGTKPVGLKKANGFGLYDMHGNVFEWCSDWYGAYDIHSVVDPTGPSAGDYRVVRGGSWYYSAQRCRSAYRSYANPVNAHDLSGIRVVFVP